ncbi:MAG: cytochrome P450 [Rhodospirillaceae bacterium]|nr:MAG: cytochrome P450 [Rhodospirillaceae bacterium]
MQSVTDLTLPYMPFDEPDFAVDPMPYLEAARRQHPWLAKCAVGYFVHEYHAIRDLYLMDDKFRNSADAITAHMGAKGTPWGRFMEEMMIAKSGPEHARLRGSVAAAFTPRSINRLRSLMREVVSNLLDEWVPRGAFDFAAFASNFPITVMFGFMGASTDALQSIRKSLETQGLSYSMDPSLLPALEEAYQVLWDFVDKLVIERQKRGGRNEGELLDEMIAANAAGRLSDVEMRELLIFLFAAAYDTSKNMTTLIMHMMLKHPEMWTRCGEDRAFCSKVVEEILRHTSTSNVPRTVSSEVIYRDVLFPKDVMLILPLSISGRDPNAFPDAMKFQPERVHVNHHIAFGRGMHMCLGQHLARAQIEEGIHLMAQRIVKPKLAGKVTWRRFPGTWGVSSLPITFEPGARLSRDGDGGAAA